MNNHVGLESLLLHKALKAQMALIGSDVGVDQDMSLHVGQQSKFPATNSTFVLFHTLWEKEKKKSEKSVDGKFSRSVNVQYKNTWIIYSSLAKQVINYFSFNIICSSGKYLCISFLANSYKDLRNEEI